jgi:hypothetical protein
MERDMAGRESEIDIEAMIDKLVQEIGADEAIKRIRAKMDEVELAHGQALYDLMDEAERAQGQALYDLLSAPMPAATPLWRSNWTEDSAGAPQVGPFQDRSSAVTQGSAIEDHKAKGERGRPVGLKYHDTDEQLIVLASFLGIEWENRGHPFPSRFALYTKVVDLCWDSEACEIWGTWFDRPDRLGPSKTSVVSRLMSRAKFPSEINPKGSKSRLHALLQPSEGEFYALVPTSEAWETMHQLRPDLRLLPSQSAPRIAKASARGEDQYRVLRFSTSE